LSCESGWTGRSRRIPLELIITVRRCASARGGTVTEAQVDTKDLTGSK
jgi:hypothetical protein